MNKLELILIIHCVNLLAISSYNLSENVKESRTNDYINHQNLFEYKNSTNYGIDENMINYDNNLFNFNEKRRLQKNSFITCSKEGHCSRADNIQLKLGWVPKIPLKNFENIFQTNEREIVSLNPFANASSLKFIKGSKNYTCADGVAECFNSCCSKGFCTDPTNVCSTALKSSAARVYATCIVFVMAAIAYWSMFAYIGVKYSKKKAQIMVEGQSNKDLNKEQFLNSVNESNRSRGMSALDNFDDKFNSEMYDFNTQNYGEENEKNIKETIQKQSKIAENDLNNKQIFTGIENNFSSKINNKLFTNNNNLNTQQKKNEYEMNEVDRPELDDHIIDQEINKRLQKSNINVYDKNKENESHDKHNDSGFEVRDLDQ